MNFTEIMNACNKVKSISSTNEKKAFLQSITDEDFKNFLKWEFDSSIVSGLSDKKLNKVLEEDMFDDDWTNCDVKTIFDVFRYLEFHGEHGDAVFSRFVTGLDNESLAIDVHVTAVFLVGAEEVVGVAFLDAVVKLVAHEPRGVVALQLHDNG